MLVVNICGSSLIVCYAKPVFLDGGKAGIQAGGMIIVGELQLWLSCRFIL